MNLHKTDSLWCQASIEMHQRSIHNFENVAFGDVVVVVGLSLEEFKRAFAGCEVGKDTNATRTQYRYKTGEVLFIAYDFPPAKAFKSTMETVTLEASP